ncbi:MAG: metal ABC transporter substrate-binding protein [Acidimicrobiales bacterium]
MRQLIPIGLIVLALTAAACGSSEPTTSSGAVTVVTSTSIWADVVGELACESELQIEALIPAGVDPHGFEPSLADRGRLDDAALVVVTGEGEEALDDTVEAAEDDGVTVVRVFDHLEVSAVEGDGHDDHDDDNDEVNHADHDDEAADGDGHDHDGRDPHVWLDPFLVIEMLPVLSDLLIDEVGLEPEAVAACQTAYEAQLREVADDITITLDGLADARRHLVTDHPFLAYFADRFSLEVVGSITTAGEASPSHLEELADAMTRADVETIFVEVGASDDDARALAERVGGVEVVGIRVDSLGPADSGADTYPGLLSTLAGAIAGQT